MPNAHFTIMLKSGQLSFPPGHHAAMPQSGNSRPHHLQMAFDLLTGHFTSSTWTCLQTNSKEYLALVIQYRIHVTQGIVLQPLLMLSSRSSSHGLRLNYTQDLQVLTAFRHSSEHCTRLQTTQNSTAAGKGPECGRHKGDQRVLQALRASSSLGIYSHRARRAGTI